jgi:3-methyladenine DNA glycosylase AlkD
MTVNEIISKLKQQANPEAVKGMAKFGITGAVVYGVSIPALRDMASEIGINNELALKLWDINSRETRILASMIGDPQKVTIRQMETWVKGFDSWEVCDQCCMNLFEKTPFAFDMAAKWHTRKEEFVKRAAFVLMARLAVSDKKAEDNKFMSFFPYIRQEAVDDRNMVKKAVNWGLRQIGKRNPFLNNKAIKIAEEIKEITSKCAQWIASDALRELKSDPVQKRLKKIQEKQGEKKK